MGGNPGIINPNTLKGQLMPDCATLDPRGGLCSEHVGEKQGLEIKLHNKPNKVPNRQLQRKAMQPDTKMNACLRLISEQQHP